MKHIHLYFTNLICFCLLLVCLFFFSSCKKFIRPLSPPDKIMAAEAFINDASATAAVTGIYRQIPANAQYFTSFGIGNFAALSADELYNTKALAAIDEFRLNALTATNSNITNIWRNAYKLVYAANACIEGLNASLTVTDSVKKQLLGEAKFMRAFCYYYLSGLFGDVPMPLTTNYKLNAALARSTVADVHLQIITDLTEALSLLKTTYVTADRTRPNQYTARALLARMYLYRQNWQAAENEANTIISSGLYSLVSNLANVFLAASIETIWQLSAAGLSYNTYEGSQYIPSSATVIPGYAATDFLLTAFETADARKTAWLKSNVVGGKTYYYPAKYKVRTGSTITENPVYFRLAELYLVRAEARLKSNNLQGAKDDINLLRARAGLPAVAATTPSALVAAIEHERQVEFFAEWGHRWFDLRRWGRIDAVLGSEKTGWQPTAALYPVPVSEIQLDPSLTQNPGY